MGGPDESLDRQRHRREPRGDMDAVRLLDGLPDLVMLIGTDGEIKYSNATAHTVLGWPRDEWIGRSILDIVHPDDVAGALSSMVALQGHELGVEGKAEHRLAVD